MYNIIEVIITKKINLKMNEQINIKKLKNLLTIIGIKKAILKFGLSIRQINQLIKKI